MRQKEREKERDCGYLPVIDPCGVENKKKKEETKTNREKRKGKGKENNQKRGESKDHYSVKSHPPFLPSSRARALCGASSSSFFCAAL
jgi:hypothetical protein